MYQHIQLRKLTNLRKNAIPSKVEGVEGLKQKNRRNFFNEGGEQALKELSNEMGELEEVILVEDEPALQLPQMSSACWGNFVEELTNAYDYRNSLNPPTSPSLLVTLSPENNSHGKIWHSDNDKRLAVSIISDEDDLCRPGICAANQQGFTSPETESLRIEENKPSANLNLQYQDASDLKKFATAEKNITAESSLPCNTSISVSNRHEEVPETTMRIKEMKSKSYKLVFYQILRIYDKENTLLVDPNELDFPDTDMKEFVRTVRDFQGTENVEYVRDLWTQIKIWLSAMKSPYGTSNFTKYHEKLNWYITELMANYICFEIENSTENEINYKRKIESLINVVSSLLNDDVKLKILTLLRVDFPEGRGNFFDDMFRNFLTHPKVRLENNDYATYRLKILAFQKWMQQKYRRKRDIVEIAVKDGAAFLPKLVPINSGDPFYKVDYRAHLISEFDNQGTRKLLEENITADMLKIAIDEYLQVFETQLNYDIGFTLLPQQNLEKSKSPCEHATNPADNIMRIQQQVPKSISLGNDMLYCRRRRHRCPNSCSRISKATHLSAGCDMQRHRLSSPLKCNRHSHKLLARKMQSDTRLICTNRSNDIISLDSTDDEDESKKNFNESSKSYTEKIYQSSRHKKITTKGQSKCPRHIVRSSPNAIPTITNSADLLEKTCVLPSKVDTIVLDSSSEGEEITPVVVVKESDNQVGNKVVEPAVPTAELQRAQRPQLNVSRPLRCALIGSVAIKPIRKEKHCIPGEVSSTTSHDIHESDRDSQTPVNSSSALLEVNNASAYENAREVGTVEILERRELRQPVVMAERCFQPGKLLLGIDYSDDENDDDGAVDRTRDHVTADSDIGDDDAITNGCVLPKAGYSKVVEEATSSTEIFPRTQLPKNVAVVEPAPQIATAMEDAPTCSKYVCTNAPISMSKTVETKKVSKSVHKNSAEIRKECKTNENNKNNDSNEGILMLFEEKIVAVSDINLKLTKTNQVENNKIDVSAESSGISQNQIGKDDIDQILADIDENLRKSYDINIKHLKKKIDTNAKEQMCGSIEAGLRESEDRHLLMGKGTDVCKLVKEHTKCSDAEAIAFNTESVAENEGSDLNTLIQKSDIENCTEDVPEVDIFVPEKSRKINKNPLNKVTAIKQNSCSDSVQERAIKTSVVCEKVDQVQLNVENNYSHKVNNKEMDGLRLSRHEVCLGKNNPPQSLNRECESQLENIALNSENYISTDKEKEGRQSMDVSMILQDKAQKNATDFTLESEGDKLCLEGTSVKLDLEEKVISATSQENKINFKELEVFTECDGEEQRPKVADTSVGLKNNSHASDGQNEKVISVHNEESQIEKTSRPTVGKIEGIKEFRTKELEESPAESEDDKQCTEESNTLFDINEHTLVSVKSAEKEDSVASEVSQIEKTNRSTDFKIDTKNDLHSKEVKSEDNKQSSVADDNATCPKMKSLANIDLLAEVDKCKSLESSEQPLIGEIHRVANTQIDDISKISSKKAEELAPSKKDICSATNSLTEEIEKSNQINDKHTTDIKTPKDNVHTSSHSMQKEEIVGIKKCQVDDVEETLDQDLLTKSRPPKKDCELNEATDCGINKVTATIATEDMETDTDLDIASSQTHLLNINAKEIAITSWPTEKEQLPTRLSQGKEPSEECLIDNQALPIIADPLIDTVKTNQDKNCQYISDNIKECAKVLDDLNENIHISEIEEETEPTEINNKNNDSRSGDFIACVSETPKILEELNTEIVNEINSKCKISRFKEDEDYKPAKPATQQVVEPNDSVELVQISALKVVDASPNGEQEQTLTTTEESKRDEMLDETISTETTSHTQCAPNETENNRTAQEIFAEITNNSCDMATDKCKPDVTELLSVDSVLKNSSIELEPTQREVTQTNVTTKMVTKVLSDIKDNTPNKGENDKNCIKSIGKQLVDDETAVSGSNDINLFDQTDTCSAVFNTPPRSLDVKHIEKESQKVLAQRSLKTKEHMSIQPCHSEPNTVIESKFQTEVASLDIHKIKRKRKDIRSSLRKSLVKDGDKRASRKMHLKHRIGQCPNINKGANTHNSNQNFDTSETAEELAYNISKLVIKENKDVVESATAPNQEINNVEKVDDNTECRETRVVFQHSDSEKSVESEPLTGSEESRLSEDCHTFQRLPLEYNSEEILAVTTLINMRNKYTGVCSASSYIDEDAMAAEIPLNMKQKEDFNETALNKTNQTEDKPTLKSALRKTIAKGGLVKKKVHYDEENLNELIMEKKKAFAGVLKFEKRAKKYRSIEGALLKGGNKNIKRRLLELNATLDKEEKEKPEINEVRTELKKTRGRKKIEPVDAETILDVENDIPIYPVRLTSRQKNEPATDFHPKAVKCNNRRIKGDNKKNVDVEDVGSNFIVPDETVVKLNVSCIDSTKINLKATSSMENENPLANDEQYDKSTRKIEKCIRKEKSLLQLELQMTKPLIVKIKRIKHPLNATSSRFSTEYQSEMAFSTDNECKDLSPSLGPSPDEPCNHGVLLEPSPSSKSPSPKAECSDFTLGVTKQPANSTDNKKDSQPSKIKRIKHDPNAIVKSKTNVSRCSTQYQPKEVDNADTSCKNILPHLEEPSAESPPSIVEPLPSSKMDRSVSPPPALKQPSNTTDDTNGRKTSKMKRTKHTKRILNDTSIPKASVTSECKSISELESLVADASASDNLSPSKVDSSESPLPALKQSSDSKDVVNGGKSSKVKRTKHALNENFISKTSVASECKSISELESLVADASASDNLSPSKVDSSESPLPALKQSSDSKDVVNGGKSSKVKRTKHALNENFISKTSVASECKSISELESLVADASASDNLSPSKVDSSESPLPALKQSSDSKDVVNGGKSSKVKRTKHALNENFISKTNVASECKSKSELETVKIADTRCKGLEEPSAESTSPVAQASTSENLSSLKEDSSESPPPALIQPSDSMNDVNGRKSLKIKRLKPPISEISISKTSEISKTSNNSELYTTDSGCKYVSSILEKSAAESITSLVESSDSTSNLPSTKARRSDSPPAVTRPLSNSTDAINGANFSTADGGNEFSKFAKKGKPSTLPSTALSSKIIENLKTVEDKTKSLDTNASGDVTKVISLIKKPLVIQKEIIADTEIKSEPLDESENTTFSIDNIDVKEEVSVDDLDASPEFPNIDSRRRHSQEIILKPSEVILTEEKINEQAEAHRSYKKKLKSKKPVRKRYKEDSSLRSSRSIPKNVSILKLASDISTKLKAGAIETPSVYFEHESSNANKVCTDASNGKKDNSEAGERVNRTENNSTIDDIPTEDTAIENTESIIAELKLLSPANFQNNEDDDSTSLSTIIENSNKPQSNDSCIVKKSFEDQKTAQLLDTSIDIVLGNSSFTKSELNSTNEEKSSSDAIAAKMETEGTNKSSSSVNFPTPTKNRLDVLTAEKINSVLEKMLEDKYSLSKGQKSSTSTEVNLCHNIKRQTNIDDEGLRKQPSRSSLSSVKEISAKVPEALFADDESESSNADDSANEQFFVPILSLDDLIKNHEPSADVTKSYNPRQKSVEEKETAHTRDGLGCPKYIAETEVKTMEASDGNAGKEQKNIEGNTKAGTQCEETVKCVEGTELNTNLEETDANFSLPAITDISTMDIPSDLNLSNEYPDLLDAMLYEQVRQSIDCMISGTNSAKKWSQDSFATSKSPVPFKNNQTEAAPGVEEEGDVPLPPENATIIMDGKPVSTNEEALGIGQESFLSTISPLDEVEVPTTGFDLVGSFTIDEFLSGAGSDLFPFPELDKTQSRANSFSTESNACNTPLQPIHVIESGQSDKPNNETAIQQNQNTNSVACDHSYNKDIKEAEQPAAKVCKKSTSSSPSPLPVIKCPTNSFTDPIKSPTMLNTLSKSTCHQKVRSTEGITTSTPKKEEKQTLSKQNSQQILYSAKIKSIEAPCADRSSKCNGKEIAIFNMPLLEQVFDGTVPNDEVIVSELKRDDISESITATEKSEHTTCPKSSEISNLNKKKITSVPSSPGTKCYSAFSKVEVSKKKIVSRVSGGDTNITDLKVSNCSPTAIEITEVITIPAPVIVQPIIRIQSQTNRLERIDPEPSISLPVILQTPHEHIEKLVDALDTGRVENNNISRPPRDSTPTLDERVRDEFDLISPNNFITAEISKAEKSPIKPDGQPAKRLRVENVKELLPSSNLYEALKPEQKIQKKCPTSPQTRTIEMESSGSVTVEDGKSKKQESESKALQESDTIPLHRVSENSTTAVASAPAKSCNSESSAIKSQVATFGNSQPYRMLPTKQKSVQLNIKKLPEIKVSDGSKLFEQQQLTLPKSTTENFSNKDVDSNTDPKPSQTRNQINKPLEVSKTKQLEQSVEGGKKHKEATLNFESPKQKLSKNNLNFESPNHILSKNKQKEDLNQTQSKPVLSKSYPTKPKDELNPNKTKVSPAKSTSEEGSIARTNIAQTNKQKTSTMLETPNQSNLICNTNTNINKIKDDKSSLATALEKEKKNSPQLVAVKSDIENKTKDRQARETQDKADIKNIPPYQTSTLTPHTKISPKISTSSNRFHPYEKPQTTPTTSSAHKPKSVHPRQQSPTSAESDARKKDFTKSNKTSLQRSTSTTTTLPPMQSRYIPYHQSSSAATLTSTDLSTKKLTPKDEAELTERLRLYRVALPAASTYREHKENQRLIKLQEANLRLELLERASRERTQKLRAEAHRLKRKSNQDSYEPHYKRFAMHASKSGGVVSKIGSHQSSSKQHPHQNAPRQRPHHEYINKFGEIEKLVKKGTTDSELKRSVPLTTSTAWEPKMPTGDELIELLSKTKKS